MTSFAEYENLPLEEVCRLCLTKQDHMLFITESGLPELLYEVASIQLSAEDTFHLVCNSCANEVSRWYIFKQKVLRSFEIARWLLNQKLINQSPKRTEEVACQTLADFCDEDLILENLHEELSCEELPLIDTNVVSIGPRSNVETVSQVDSVSNKPVTRGRYINPNILSYENEDLIGEDHDVNNAEDIVEMKKKRKRKASYICDTCKRSCPTKTALIRHQKVHKDRRDYVCSKCNKAFKQMETLKDHMKRHYDLKKFACDQCGKKFYRQYYVTLHMRTHTGEKPYNCDHCNKTFSRPLSLRNHMKQRHTDEKRYTCQICSKGFIDSWQLKVHMRTHTGEKPYKCPHCDMCFAVSSSLHSHIRYKHTLEKNFICSTCAKAFTAKHTLESHMRTHTGEKRPPRHECSTCGKKCDTTSSLQYHIRSAHTGEKPYGCNICGKRYLRKQHLTAHMVNHTGAKPYTCQICDKSFSNSSTFSIHKRLHTGEKPFVCQHCQQAFVHSNALKQHVNKAHKNLTVR